MVRRDGLRAEDSRPVALELGPDEVHVSLRLDEAVRGAVERDEPLPGSDVLEEGRLLGRIPIPEDLVTNLTFGPPGRKTLYVTAGRNLYRMPIEVEGYVLHS